MSGHHQQIAAPEQEAQSQLISFHIPAHIGWVETHFLPGTANFCESWPILMGPGPLSRVRTHISGFWLGPHPNFSGSRPFSRVQTKISGSRLGPGWVPTQISLGPGPLSRVQTSISGSRPGHNPFLRILAHILRKKMFPHQVFCPKKEIWTLYSRPRPRPRFPFSLQWGRHYI
jgi:hypothetical protein